MNSSDYKGPDPKLSEESKFINYQTNKIPWYIHLMWMSFAVIATIYLLKNALSDFLRWW